MAIKTYGDAIRRARRMAGQTQAQLCEGICDVMTLSRIETNRNRVSPELFQILMQRTGQDCRMTLEFESREVFEMHQALENAQFRIRMGKLSDAYAYLCQVAASSEYLNHVCRCQKFELAQIQLQLACGASNSLRLCRAAAQSLRRTCPEYEKGCFPNRLLSAQEIELLLAISELYTHCAHTDRYPVLPEADRLSAGRTHLLSGPDLPACPHRAHRKLGAAAPAPGHPDKLSAPSDTL